MTAIDTTTPDLTEPLRAAVVVEVVIRAVAYSYRLSTAQITGRMQARFMLGEARQVAMALCVRLSKATPAQVGQRFSGRAASAVQRAIALHRRMIDQHAYRVRVEYIEQEVLEATQS